MSNIHGKRHCSATNAAIPDAHSNSFDVMRLDCIRRHPVGSITNSLRGLIPASLLPTKHSSVWETTILASWKTLGPEVRASANKHYVQALKDDLPYFGHELFPVV